MNIAVIGTSKKENEKRRPLHPDHFSAIPPDIRAHLFFEKSYGEPFGMSDDEISSLTGNKTLSRLTLLNDFQSIIITKPVVEDFEEIQPGTQVCGWLHSVQQMQITQQAIDKKLTLLSWENMYHSTDRELIHVFYRNNELAGYCGVQHALECVGLDGNYGSPLSAAVICFGSVSRGAIYSLLAHGIRNITIYTQRNPSYIANQIPGLQYKQFIRSKSGRAEVLDLNGSKTLLLDALSSCNIIINGILQNSTDPLMLIGEKDISLFRSKCLVIDVSCSKSMGFYFAKPTTFTNPVFDVGNITYYGVDHTPALMWSSATWEISRALMPYIPFMVEETESITLSDAIDIRQGEILNNDIILYQKRSAQYPYKQL